MSITNHQRNYSCTSSYKDIDSTPLESNFNINVLKIFHVSLLKFNHPPRFHAKNYDAPFLITPFQFFRRKKPQLLFVSRASTLFDAKQTDPLQKIDTTQTNFTAFCFALKKLRAFFLFVINTAESFAKKACEKVKGPRSRNRKTVYLYTKTFSSLIGFVFECNIKYKRGDRKLSCNPRFGLENRYLFS